MASNKKGDLPKGVKAYKSRGKDYFYHRPSGKRLNSAPGTAAFLLEIDALDKKQAPKMDAGSLAKLIEAYRESDSWKDLAPSTRLSYERAFAAMKPIHGRPLKEFTPPFVASYRDVVSKARKRWMANYVLTVLVILFDVAREKGWVKDNPAKGIKRIGRDKKRPRANRSWTMAECRAVLDAAPLYLAVPIGLAMLAGFRKGDVLSMEWSAVQDGALVHKTAKRDVDVSFPISLALANLLSIAPRSPDPKVTTIAITSRGTSWTGSGFNSMFCKLINRLEADGTVAPGLTMHGLRHTVGTRLKEAGAEIDDMERLLGHQSPAMSKHYSRTANINEKTTLLIGKMKILDDAKALDKSVANPLISNRALDNNDEDIDNTKQQLTK